MRTALLPVGVCEGDDVPEDDALVPAVLHHEDDAVRPPARQEHHRHGRQRQRHPQLVTLLGQGLLKPPESGVGAVEVVGDGG